MTKNIPDFTNEWNNFNTTHQENVKVVDIILSQPNEESLNNNSINENKKENSKNFSIWDCYM